jgi:hypothetical protein
MGRSREAREAFRQSSKTKTSMVPVVSEPATSIIRVSPFRGNRALLASGGG